MFELNLLQRIAVWALPVLFAITVHEVAHGWVARRFGDPTAMMLGRLTLNPLKHIDPVGTLLIPGLMLLVGFHFIFGWAKPVPVSWQNLRHPKQDMVWVALAGPVANLIMAIGWAVIAKVGIMTYSDGSLSAVFMLYSGVAGIYINVILMTINLLPLPPLDGGRVLTGLLPGPLAWQVSRVEPYGFIILMVLFYFNVLNYLLMPVIFFFDTLFMQFAGMKPALYEAALTALMGH
jgi:Zn-dependent protease